MPPGAHMTQRKLEPRTVLLNCCSAVFPRRPSSDFLRSICCAAVTKLLLADVPWPGRRSEWGGELKVGVCELGGGGLSRSALPYSPSAARPSRCPVGRWEGWRCCYAWARRVRFRAVVGRVEWKVLYGVEKARGSWGGRGRAIVCFAGSRLTAIVKYSKVD